MGALALDVHDVEIALADVLVFRKNRTIFDRKCSPVIKSAGVSWWSTAEPRCQRHSGFFSTPMAGV